MRNLKIAPPPSHFKASPVMSRKRQVALFLLGAMGFALLGLVWFGIFSVLGLGVASPRDVRYWEAAYESMPEAAVEAMLVEQATLAGRRLSASKPCVGSAAAALVAMVKKGCGTTAEQKGQKKLQTMLDLSGSRVEAIQRSKIHSAKAIAESLLGGGKVKEAEPPKETAYRLAHVAAPAWWKGPALLDPWRNVGGRRTRQGWKYESGDNVDTIFVSVASYRDRRCSTTLFELFAHAKRPSRVNVGVVQQNDESDEDCFAEYCRRAGSYCRPSNVRIMTIPASESRGVMVVRHYASSLYEGEEYFLQLDAHNKVTQNWDVLLIDDLKKVKNERAVLSHHPPATDSFAGWTPRSAINICKYEWDGNGLPRFSANVVTAPASGPFPGVFIGAGMVFARAELLVDCPFDSHLPFLFSGEELLLAACAFSHGWDLYNPSVTPMFHYYKGGATGDKSINPVNDVVHAKSLKRLKYALGVSGTFDDLSSGEFREDFDVYAMGSARRLDQYYKYAGIDWLVKDRNFPFCKTHEESYYTFHNTPVAGLPALSTLSFDKGIPRRPAKYPVLTGSRLKSADI